ncbi:unnamed protein product, partial [Candidula unifasciata]
SDDCVVAVTIEMGHRANFRTEPSPEGFSHDWTVFVRGFEGSRLEYFVEKVIFKLHKTFRSPTRVITDPPFRVTESGYAGFTMPIEIYFKNKQTPRKIVFSYDLFLNIIDCPPINHVRYEKLKFKNPTPDFKAMLIKAGGKKNKSKRQLKSASPATSLSSLSPMSSDNDDTRPPPPPVKQEKESSSGKKESSLSSKPKHDSSSSHKDRSKHRSSSSHSSHRERPDKETSHKSHKHKDKTKERDRSSSHKDKDAVKKDKDVGSQKIVKENLESRKEREGSHSSGKSSTSSSQVDNKVAAQVSHKEREKNVPSKDKDTTRSSKEKRQSSSKEKEKLPKEKHSSYKDVSQASHSEPKKVKEDMGKENDVHQKSSKRHVESTNKVEKEKLKRSSAGSTNEKSKEAKSSSGKENHVSRDSTEKESSKEGEESNLAASHKSKHKRNRHSKKKGQSHSPEIKHEKSTEKLSESPQLHENLSHSERLAVTAISHSPFRNKSGEEESTTQQEDLKSVLNKQSEQPTQVQDTTLKMVARSMSAEEIPKQKVESEPTKHDAKKYSKAKKKAKSKNVEQKTECLDAANTDNVQHCYGLDMLAANGISIGELIVVTEQIAKAHTHSDRELLEKVTRIIGETDDFDISDVFLSFDICSVDKTVVRQIQALFREC